ncbi:MAG: hypothetical protein V4641_05565 [Pseudomonadota bacterium]
MTITFEGYDLDSGSFALKQQPRARLSDRTHMFLLRYQPKVAMTATLTTHGSFPLVAPPPPLRLVDRTNVFLLRSEPFFALSGSVPLPAVSVFMLSSPGHAMGLTTTTTTHGNFPLHQQPKLLLSGGKASFLLRYQPQVYLSDGHVSLDRTGYLVQQPELLAHGFEGAAFGASSAVALGHDHLTKQIVWVLRSLIALTDNSHSLIELLRSITDHLSLRDLVTQVFAVRAASSVALSDTAAWHEVLLLALVDRIALLGHTHSIQEATRAIALVLALSDAAAKPTFGILLSHVALSDALVAEVEAYAKAIDAIRISAEVSQTLLLTLALKDAVLLTDGTNRLLEITKALRDSFAATVSLQIEGVGYTAWVMGMDSKTVWSYDDYPFNSFATIGNRRFAAGPDGISELTGSDDNGTEIAWSIRTGLSNLDSDFKKRLDIAYLGYTSDGTVGLSVMATAKDGVWTQYNYTLQPVPSQDPITNRIKLGLGVESVYYAFQYAGTGPFTLSSARILKLNTKRRV